MGAFRLNRFRVATRVHGGIGSLIAPGLAVASGGPWQRAWVERDTDALALTDQVLDRFMSRTPRQAT